MKIPFLRYDNLKEISTGVYEGFVSTFYKNEIDSESDPDFDSDIDSPDPSDFDSSDWDDLDLSPHQCSEVTESVEEMVKTVSDICHPLEDVYGTTAGGIMKETIRTATEETECVGLRFFADITPGEDRTLIESCATVCYWCCCETIQKVSPVIAGATINLLK
jgi:hypothetical protein